jgi:hypothetical protein
MQEGLFVFRQATNPGSFVFVHAICLECRALGGHKHNRGTIGLFLNRDDIRRVNRKVSRQTPAPSFFRSLMFGNPTSARRVSSAACQSFGDGFPTSASAEVQRMGNRRLRWRAQIIRPSAFTTTDGARTVFARQITPCCQVFLFAGPDDESACAGHGIWRSAAASLLQHGTASGRSSIFFARRAIWFAQTPLRDRTT